MIKEKLHRGYILLGLVLIIGITVPLLIIFVGWSVTSLRVVERTLDREIALHIAEAGIDYYRWHLSHDPLDFQDGTGGPGPYIHDFEDKDGNVIGTFTLDITAPDPGETLVIVESEGATIARPDITRTIRAKFDATSLSRFSIIQDTTLRIFEGTEVFGPLHSNGGIRFDGYAHNIVTSAKETYTDSDQDACTRLSWGVHTCVDPEDPSPSIEPPLRPDVFGAGRSYPVPQIDFTGFSTDFAELKEDAEDSGHYYGPSGEEGYQITLQTDDTYIIEEVTELVPSPSQHCRDNQSNKWDTWTVQTTSSPATYTFPADGIIFVEDHVWVRGQIDGARINIASAAFPEIPSNYTSITVNESMLYSNYDGTDVVGLMAQDDINIGMESDFDLRIDGSLVAQHGRIGRYYYDDDCAPWDIRGDFTNYGMLANSKPFEVSYPDNTGYQTINLIYDNNLFFSPPPGFPLTSTSYELVSWEELK